MTIIQRIENEDLAIKHLRWQIANLMGRDLRMMRFEAVLDEAMKNDLLREFLTKVNPWKPICLRCGKPGHLAIVCEEAHAHPTLVGMIWDRPTLREHCYLRVVPDVTKWLAR